MSAFEFPLAGEAPPEPKQLDLLLDPAGWDKRRAVLVDPANPDEAWLRIDASALQTTTEAR